LPGVHASRGTTPRLPSPPGALEVQTTNVSTTVPSSGSLHFSTRGEYGVRLMVELARHYGSGPVSLSEMAEHEDLPRPYLEQLVVSLREAGLVTSTRGARGGYELSRPPASVRMSEVITALEGPIAPMVCASDDPHHADACERAGFCNVERLWQRVRAAIVVALDSMTLEELAGPAPGHPAHPEAALVAVQPLPERSTKEPVAQP
jgi:Rrf2 family transcriptional regulator, cysteine metabolism repressor